MPKVSNIRKLSAIKYFSKKDDDFRNHYYFRTLPKHLIEKVGWKEGDEVLFSVKNGKIILQIVSKTTRWTLFR